MKLKHIYIFISLSLAVSACKKDKPTPTPNPPPKPVDTSLKVTSEQYDGKLLFVNKNNFQIATSKPGTFSSTDSKIKISSTGLIERITSGEVAAITITPVAEPTKKLTIYALGATDDQHDEPYSKYHDYAASSTDPFSDYRKGWATLQKLPTTNETYGLVLRHADASVGSDRTESTEPEWWKSGDATLARQLNQQGIDRATELGKIFKDLQLPIARVISSEFRRSTQTVELLNTGLDMKIDGRLNHSSYNKSGLGLFTGMTRVVAEEAVADKITLLVAHHPMNELRNVQNPNFPKVMAFTWTGGYFVKVSPDKTLSYQGSVSYAMFKYWRDLKLGRL